MSEEYTRDNLLDRATSIETRRVHDEHMKARERQLVARLGVAGGEVLAVGAGWDPGRHMFPAPAFRLTAVDLREDQVRWLVDAGEADAGQVARAGELPFDEESFDVVLYRLALHHIVYQRALGPVFAEARRLLRPGGALVAVEPGLWHPVGAALAIANGLGLGVRVHGTPDDIPLSPLRLARESRTAGLDPELHAVSFGWRRLPRAVQRALHPLDRLGSVPGLRLFGHELFLIARRAGR